MSKTYLILDANYLARRALYSMGNLTHGDVKTGMIYGFFKDVQNLQDRFGTNHVIFCFDYGKGIRKEMFPDYKVKRHKKERSPEEELVEEAFHLQIDRLREKYLPYIGYKNIFYQWGYEGDDIVASITQDLPDEDEAIMVTADEDLFQLIKPNVTFYNPNKQKMYTIQSFKKEYGIEADQWWKVKALGGCKTDEVPSVAKGVGEGTAIKYIRGALPKHYKAYHDIRTPLAIANRKRNIPLVKLPLSNVNRFVLQTDTLTDKKWNKFCDRLGFKSMRNKAVKRKKRNLGVVND